MQNVYTAYTKTINGIVFHFVKHFQTFPEYSNVPPFLENYAMHTDFYKACKIALIQDKSIQNQLWDTIKNTAGSAEIIQMNRGKVNSYNYRNWQRNLPGILSWIGVRKLLHVKQRIA